MILKYYLNSISLTTIYIHKINITMSQNKNIIDMLEKMEQIMFMDSQPFKARAYQKAKDAVKLFTCIHSVDREKLVDALSIAEESLTLKREYFLQVNTGNEGQKSGINIKNLEQLYKYTKRKLKVVGLMCIPPFDKESFSVNIGEMKILGL